MQAYQFVELEQGITMDNWDFSDVSSGSHVERAENYYNTFFDNKYFNVLSAKRGLWPGTSYREAFEVTFADGSIMYLWAGSAMDILIDVNGKKGPNEDGRDCFKFMHYPKQKVKPYIVSGGRAHNREKALDVCKRYKAECMPLIMNFDNWEFKDDYPYRL